MGENKKRHGCLTAWLILMLIGNAAVILIYTLGIAAVRRQYPSAPAWAFPALCLGSIVNVACAIALFRWKKWGFFGFTVTTIIAFAVNLTLGLNILQTLSGLLGIAILYGVLQIGGEKKGWTQLE